jgi:hypothetical protein
LIKQRADSFGCLAIGFIGALFASWILLGLGMMADLADERLRPPLWESAGGVMAVCFGAALVVSTGLAGRSHRLPVFIVGLVVAVTLYVVIGLFWWFRVA